MTIRKRHPNTEPATVWPRCDRCNRRTKPEWLTDDGLGMVCPPCRVGGAVVTGEALG